MKDHTEKTRHKRQAESLHSGNTQRILETLKDIRQSGQANILPEVFFMLKNKPDTEVLQEALRLIRDLKDETSVPYLLQAIQDHELQPIRRDLIASCWQNALDYHEYLDVFIDIAAEGNYETAIEALTVIENSITSVPENEKTQYAQRITDHLKGKSAEKKRLLETLTDIIRES